MYRFSVPLLLMILALVSMRGAASRIELVDGTEINGEVVSVSGDNYVIRSSTLGQIEVPESSIRSVRPYEGSRSDNALSTELQPIQQQIVNSPELMAMVAALQADPELQAAINDPQLIQLVMSGNLDGLRDDPRILRLLANPTIQAIVGKMSAQ